MKKITLILCFIFAVMLNLGAEAVFFSEYIEGGSSNKAVELYNSADSTVSLAGYKIEVYSNGGTTAGYKYEFTDQQITSGGTFVIVNSGADDKFKVNGSVTSTITYFNGDDAVVLLNPAGDTIDIIGIVGNDPGTEWPVGAGSTKDHTLVRKSSVASGNSVFTASEWDVYSKDESFLGSHDCDSPHVSKAISGYTALTDITISDDLHLLTLGDVLESDTLPEYVELVFSDGNQNENVLITDWSCSPDFDGTSQEYTLTPAVKIPDGYTNKEVVDPVLKLTVSTAQVKDPVFVMAKADYQAIVDFVNRHKNQMHNSSKYDNSEYYFGASSYYNNFANQSGRFNSVFDTITYAIDMAFKLVTLPENYADAAQDDTISIKYNVYDGKNTSMQTMKYKVTSVEPLTFVNLNDEIESFQEPVITGIENAVNNGIYVYSSDGYINIIARNGNIPVVVYNINGVRVYEKTVKGSVRIPENKGVYIIKSGTFITKVIVK